VPDVDALKWGFEECLAFLVISLVSGAVGYIAGYVSGRASVKASPEIVINEDPRK
jgi:uncharacterized membrane protein YtjA (UPF0391 family)